MNRFLRTIIILSLIFSGCVSTLSQKNSDMVDPKKLYSPEELKNDMDYLFQTMEDVHPNLYAYTPKLAIDSLREKAESQFEKSITAMEFWKIVNPLVVKLKEGHTFLSFPYTFRQQYLDEGGTIFPLEVQINGNQLQVRRNYSSDSTLALHSEILSINAISAGEILQELRRYKAGESAGFVNRYIQRMFKPLLWVHYGFEDRFKVEYISSSDGEYYTKILSGITSEEYDSLTQNNAKVKQKPTYWTFQSILDEKTGIIDLNSFASEKYLKTFKKFLKSTFTTIHNEGLTNLIIDLRRNGGGDTQLGEALIDYLATKPWVLLSRAEVRLSPQFKKDLFPWFLRWLPIKTAITMHSASCTVQQVSIEWKSYQI